MSKDFDTPDMRAAAEIVANGDPDRFAAAMAASLKDRAILLPLYAFNVEVSRAPWISAEPMIGEMRLQWWQDVLGEIAHGKPPRAHPVVRLLSARLGLDAALILQELVAGRRWDIYDEPFENTAHFERYIDQTSGNLMCVAAQLLGARDLAPVRDIAWAAGLANFFAAVPELLSRGRQPFVREDHSSLRELAADGLARLDAGRALVHRSTALYPAANTRAVLMQAWREPGRIRAGTLGVSPFRKRWALLRASLTGRI